MHVFVFQVCLNSQNFPQINYDVKHKTCPKGNIQRGATEEMQLVKNGSSFWRSVVQISTIGGMSKGKVCRDETLQPKSQVTEDWQSNKSVQNSQQPKVINRVRKQWLTRKQGFSWEVWLKCCCSTPPVSLTGRRVARSDGRVRHVMDRRTQHVTHWTSDCGVCLPTHKIFHNVRDLNLLLLCFSLLCFSSVSGT